MEEFKAGWHYFWAGYSFSLMFLLGMMSGVVVIDTIVTTLIHIWKGIRDLPTS